MIFKALFENLTLLLALSTVHSFTLRFYKQGTVKAQCIMGVIFGSVAFIVMKYPYVLAPGLIFDTRSVLLSTVGLFGGSISATIAVLITGSYRLWLGGPGMNMGIGVIVTSAVIGVIYHKKYSKSLDAVTPFNLYILGLIVHFFMIVWIFAVPMPLRLAVLKQISLPVIVIYPLGNLLLGLLLVNQESRFQIETKLKESEQRYRELVQNANSIILRMNPQGVITFVNDFALQFFGYSKEEILGRNVVGSIVPESESTGRNLKAMVEDILRHPEKYEKNENENITKDGRRVWIVWSNKAIYDSNGHFAEILCVGNDNTKQKSLEEQLIHSQKMESVGRLAGGIAHDFNNLLVIINGYSQLALQKIPPHSPIYKDIDSILKAGERAAALTRQLLAFSRKQVVQPRIINLNITIVELDKMLRRLIGEHIELATLPTPSLSSIKADPGQIEQIIINMAVNARDAMPNGGKLTIETSNANLDESYAQQHAEVVPGDYAMLAISDSGCGMDKETMSKIFDPFFTTKEFGKGTGLGLSTVYGIVKQCGGHIWTYSEPGKGTTFKIYFPSAKAAAAKEEFARDSIENLQGSETILLVEDEAAVRKLLSRVLCESGYRVLEASCGGEASSLFEQNKESISLVITDVVMPGMNGRELSEQLAASLPGVKILFLSGYTGENALLGDILEEGAAFIQKPIAVREFLRKIKEVLGT